MAWGTSRCGKHRHRIYFQQREESCALACTLMALQRKNKLNSAGARYRQKRGLTVTNKPLTEDEARQASQLYGGSGYYRPSAQDGGANTSDLRYRMVADMMMQTLGSEGTGTCLPNIARTLTALGVPAQYRNNVNWAQVVAAAGKNVVISAVRWRGGGGHAILLEKVVRGWKKGKGLLSRRKRVNVSICVCDPIFGASRALLAGAKKPIYRPASGSAGTFSAEMVTL